MKTLLNAPDIEYARKLLDQTGLREKLLEMDGFKTKEQGSLSWWLNKEPLKSFKVGKGNGKTALDLGIDIVSHETNDFQAYESITRSTHGSPNVFISRKETTGEAAAFGDGFYTRVGTTGARGTGITVRFKMNPQARAKTDFLFIEESGFVVILNKNVLETIPEDINISIIDFFKLMGENNLSENDKGLLEKITRKFARYQATEQEIKAIHKYLKENVLNKLPEGFDSNLSTILSIWFSMQGSEKYPKIVEQLIEESASYHYSHGERGIFHTLLSSKVFNHQHWKSQVYLLEMMLETKMGFGSLLSFSLSEEHWVDRFDLVEKVIDGFVRGNDLTKLRPFIHEPHWAQSRELAKYAESKKSYFILLNILPYWLDDPISHQWAKEIEANYKGLFVESKLMEAYTSNINDFTKKEIKNLLNKNLEIYVKSNRLSKIPFNRNAKEETGKVKDATYVLREFLKSPAVHLPIFEEYVFEILKLNDYELIKAIISNFLKESTLSLQDKYIDFIIRKKDFWVIESILTEVLYKDFWLSHKKITSWMKLLLKRIVKSQNEGTLKVLSERVLKANPPGAEKIVENLINMIISEIRISRDKDTSFSSKVKVFLRKGNYSTNLAYLKVLIEHVLIK